MSERQFTFNFGKYRHEKLEVKDLPQLFRDACEDNKERGNYGAAIAFADAATIVDVIVEESQDDYEEFEVVNNE